ncbi:hypothetical protein P7C73_g1972, partial [Tremellales sp. Uapishka_1]
MAAAATMTKRAILIGLGGASCSGKTLLARHLRNVLTSATILHQDDFCPPADKVPYSATHPDVQDWDDPPTCILWPDFRAALRHVKQTAELPLAHSSHDHLNKQVEIAVEPRVYEEYGAKLRAFEESERTKGTEIAWFIVDGFVLYWDAVSTASRAGPCSWAEEEVVTTGNHGHAGRAHPVARPARDPEVEERRATDICPAACVPLHLLIQRFMHSSLLSDPDDAAAGGVWEDPPNYFSQIVWPGYVKAHEHVYRDGDVEHGIVVDKRIQLVHPGDGAEGMTRALEECCVAVLEMLGG